LRAIRYFFRLQLFFLSVSHYYRYFSLVTFSPLTKDIELNELVSHHYSLLLYLSIMFQTLILQYFLDSFAYIRFHAVDVTVQNVDEK
jgi:hypothetical protein